MALQCVSDSNPQKSSSLGVLTQWLGQWSTSNLMPGLGSISGALPWPTRLGCLCPGQQFHLNPGFQKEELLIKTAVNPVISLKKRQTFTVRILLFPKSSVQHTFQRLNSSDLKFCEGKNWSFNTNIPTQSSSAPHLLSFWGKRMHKNVTIKELLCWGGQA